MKLCGYFLAYFLVLHFTACVFHDVVDSYEPVSSEECRQQSGVWFVCEGAIDASLATNYSRAFYASVLLLLGNDAVPRTTSEELFSFITMLAGVFISSIIVGSFASLISALDKTGAVKQSHFDR